MLARDDRTKRVPHPHPGDGRPGLTLWLLSALTVASLVVRLWFFEAYAFAGTDCDGASYMDLARSIAGGEGWVTHSLRFLFLLPPSMPQPDAHWSPLYPILTSLSYIAFGESFTSAKLVPLVFGTLVPGVVFLLCAALTRSWRTAFVAGVLAVFHPTLVTWSLRIETEIVSAFFVGLVFVFLFSHRAAARPYWLGLALGLAYLTKYQSILLWAPVVLFYAVNDPWRTAGKRLAVAAATFVAVISPWLVRNVMTFGDPLYTAVRHNMISYYPEFGGEPRYLSSLQMPVSAWDYMRTHAGTVLEFSKSNVQLLARAFFQQNEGSRLLIALAVPGVLYMVRAWKPWASLLLFVVLLVGVTSIAIPQVRYLHPLVPIWIAVVAVGAGWLLEKAGGRWMFAIPVWLFLLVAVVGETRSTVERAQQKGSEWSPSANFCALEAQAASGPIQERTTPDEAVFAPEPFHYALLLERNAIQIPFDEDALVSLSRRYDVRYMVITTRDLRKRLPSWEEHLPAWARLVLFVPSGDIPRPPGNPDYGFVSDLRVYELTAE